MKIWKSFKEFVGIVLLLMGCFYTPLLFLFLILLILNNTVIKAIEDKIEEKFV